MVQLGKLLRYGMMHLVELLQYGFVQLVEGLQYGVFHLVEGLCSCQEHIYCIVTFSGFCERYWVALFGILHNMWQRCTSQ